MTGKFPGSPGPPGKGDRASLEYIVSPFLRYDMNLARFASKWGEGSRFSFTAMFKRGTEDKTTEVLREHWVDNGRTLEFADARILVVEDSTINQQVARELLQGVGLSVTIAENGKEAVDLVARQAFDLVLIDNKGDF